MGIGDELEKLSRLHQEGALTDAEFESAKSQVLRDGSTASDSAHAPPVDPARGDRIAADLRSLGVQGILITAAEQGYITELKCQMPECLCPEELGGRTYFEPITGDLPPWMPSHDHIHLKAEGGQRTVENSRLGHRLCNRVDYNKNHGISYAKDLATADAARRAARGQSPRDPSTHLGDAFVAPGDTVKDKARFIKENLKDPDTQKAFKDLVRNAPKDFVEELGDLMSVFRNKRRDYPKQHAEVHGMIEDVRPVLTVADFQAALASGMPIVNVDVPTEKVVLHSRPASCPGINEEWFQQKVVENEGRTGGYFLVSDETSARSRWPTLVMCQRCS